jgi:predicted acyl esterase
MRIHRVFATLFALPFLLSNAAAFEVQGGIEFVAITGTTPGTELVLDDWNQREVERGTSDRFGSLIFRYLRGGRTYSVREAAGGGSVPVDVLSFRDHPDDSFYQSKTLTEGFQYIETRDGTLLAAMVRAPLGKTLAEGPFPTVVEYSGYAVAEPNLGSAQPSTLLTFALGFATVAVNMRGSGCSGGVMGLFDLPATADGYDIIETVAAQPWVKGSKVGMVGISFPGISQLYVGGARPPHLAAIAPLSVIADIYRAPGFPGGIFNDGFAKTWLQERKDDARPAPEGGQGYAIRQVNAGDQTCLANQRLRLQTLDPIEFVQQHPYYEPDLMDERSPINWVRNIEVPVFLSSAWQDEQTGGDFASMLGRLPRRKNVKITTTNGVHTSPFDPEILLNWVAFLDLYVADVAPTPSRVQPFAPIIYSTTLAGSTLIPPFPPDRFAGITDYRQARQLFESDPHVRVLMENGAGSPTPGLPAPTFELGFSKWPPSEVKPAYLYFGKGGKLSRSRPRSRDSGIDRFRPDPDARPRQTLPGTGQGDSWEIIPPYEWAPLADGTALAYATPALDEDVTVVGPGSVDLWLRSSAEDTDLQVTLSEIRPDGLETYVQNGWIRASHRKLDRRASTVLLPRPTHLERHARPMPEGEFTKIRVELFSVAHVFRKGSRIRISIEAPGGDRTRWTFDTPATNGDVLNEVTRTAALPSRLVLPVVDDEIDVPAGLPPCPGLRGQPCRTYVPAANGG